MGGQKEVKPPALSLWSITCKGFLWRRGEAALPKTEAREEEEEEALCLWAAPSTGPKREAQGLGASGSLGALALPYSLASEHFSEASGGEAGPGQSRAGPRPEKVRGSRGREGGRPGAGAGSLGGRARARAAAAPPPGRRPWVWAAVAPMSGLPEFLGLLGLSGGPGRVLLVGQGPSGTKAGLQAFARELFAPGDQEEEEKLAEGARGVPPPPGREVRVRLGGSPGPLPLPGAVPPGLVLVLVGAPSLLEPRERRLLREMLLDLDLRLRRAAPRRPAPAPAPALVGVAVLPAREEEGGRGEEARCQLEGLLRRSLGPGRPPQTLQAALHRPGAGAPEVRAAACSALRAALLLRRSRAAQEEEEPKKQRLPLFFKCLPWGRRRQQRKGHLGADASKFNEDSPQDQDEGLALT